MTESKIIFRESLRGRTRVLFIWPNNTQQLTFSSPIKRLTGRPITLSGTPYVAITYSHNLWHYLPKCNNLHKTIIRNCLVKRPTQSSFSGGTQFVNLGLML